MARILQARSVLGKRPAPATNPRGVVETLKVRPIDGRFAFVSLRVDGWSITDVMVQRTDAGHRITWPTSEANGERYPVVTPPPGLREALERQIAEAFEAAVGASRSRP